MRDTICGRSVCLGEYPCERPGSKNECWLDIDLYGDNGHVNLSICGTVYHHDRTDILMAGQCLDRMAAIPGMSDNATFSELYGMWKKYHNNGMHAGTHRQEDALEEAGIHGYEASCAFLKERGMYRDDLSDDESVYGHEDDPVKRKGLAYGEAWIVRKLPEDVVSRVKEICGAKGECTAGTYGEKRSFEDAKVTVTEFLDNFYDDSDGNYNQAFLNLERRLQEYFEYEPRDTEDNGQNEKGGKTDKEGHEIHSA